MRATSAPRRGPDQEASSDQGGLLLRGRMACALETRGPQFCLGENEKALEMPRGLTGRREVCQVKRTERASQRGMTGAKPRRGGQGIKRPGGGEEGERQETGPWSQLGSAQSKLLQPDCVMVLGSAFELPSSWKSVWDWTERQGIATQ